MVFEFLHNFGQTLGFGNKYYFSFHFEFFLYKVVLYLFINNVLDMDTLPSLNTLQMALLPDCCVDAEEELISVMTHLLACAIGNVFVVCFL